MKFYYTKIALTIALTQVSLASLAQFPDKPVKIVVPYTAGGSTDVLSREFAQALSAAIGQPVIIDNRAGGDGSVGSQAAARAAPDGYTALVGTNSTHVLAQLMTKVLPYDAVKDFTPVCTLGRSKNVMYIRSSLPHKSVGEFLADAKANPDKYTFAYVSAGTRLAGELLQQLGKVKLRGVPYRSTSGALTDVVGGQVDVTFSDQVSAIPFMQGGRIRPLAVTGSERAKTLPEVPTMVEAGLSSYEMQPWYAVFLPVQTPRAIVDKFIEGAEKAVASPAMQAARVKLGVDDFLLCDAKLAGFQGQEISRWGKVVQDANIQPQ